MRGSRERPTGVRVLAIVLAIKGLVSLAMSGDLVSLGLARSTSVEAVPAGIALITSLLLLNRAWGLWTFQRTSWLTLIILIGFNVVAALWKILLGTSTAVTWVSLILGLSLAFYLLRPSVRQLFDAEHHAP
jgi:hypothetical protein